MLEPSYAIPQMMGIREKILTMPKTYRDNLKRQLAHGYHDLELAGSHIYQVALPFEEQHPEMAESLKAVMEGLIVMMEVLNTFAINAWGRDSVNWESWRALSEAQVGSHADEQPMD